MSEQLNKIERYNQSLILTNETLIKSNKKQSLKIQKLEQKLDFLEGIYTKYIELNTKNLEKSEIIDEGCRSNHPKSLKQIHRKHKLSFNLNCKFLKTHAEEGPHTNFIN